jgi:N-acetylglutamate synthase-like GNAT family acetyltransferase
MKFLHTLGVLDLSEQVASLINAYNGLSFRRTAIDVRDGKVDYVVETHGKWVIGCCGYEKLGHHLTEIKHLTVSKDWRRRGVGGFLIKSVLNLCETPAAFSTVREDNKSSLSLFQSQGFTPALSYSAEGHEVILLTRVSPKWQKVKTDWKLGSFDDQFLLTSEGILPGLKS